MRIREFLSYYKPYCKLFFAVSLCAVTASLAALATPLVARYITKDLLEGGFSSLDATRPILLAGGLLLFLGILQTVCESFYDYRGHAMGAMMETDMRDALFAKYETLSFRFFDSNHTGQLMSRLTNDLINVAEFAHHVPEDILMNTVKFVGSFAVLFSINRRLTLYIFLLLLPIAVLAGFINKRMRTALRRSYARMGDVNSRLEDSLSGVRLTQSYAREAEEIARFREDNAAFLDARKAVYRHQMQFYQTIEALARLLNVLIVVGGALLITRQAMDLPDLVAFLLYVGYLTQPLQGLAHTIVQIQEGWAGFERFQEIMETTPDIRDAENAVDIGRARGEIRFEGVGFHYDGDTVLENIDLRITAGETVAFVGHSGVGKSTLCSLIPRFYDVSAGRVLLDGLDVREISLHSLRRNIGIVQQDTFLFGGTVAENIGYSRPDASREEIEQAAREAQAHDFIMALPQGYDTNIGQRGVKLSGGQKQRLSIARVFLADPPVLILDEATSALDYAAEQAVQEALAALTKERTTLIIAHRLSTVQNADTIVALSEKGICEQGDHATLLRQGGLYASMTGYL